MSVKIKRLILFIALLLFIGFAGNVPLEQSIDCLCVVEPAAVWQIIRDGGQISTEWKKKLLGSDHRRTLRQFESPDIVEVKLSVGEGYMVQAGDTVAQIESYQELGQLRELESQLSEAIARRQALRAAVRPEDQAVALERLKRVQATLEAYQSEYDRKKELFEKEIITLADWQEVQSKYRYYQADVDVFQARYEATLVGARSVDVSVVDAEISRLQQSILTARNSVTYMETIVSPMDGMVHLGGQETAILTVEQTDTVAVRIIIPEIVAGKYAVGNSVSMQFIADHGIVRDEKITRSEFNGTDRVNAHGILFLSNDDRLLVAGMNGVARLPLGSLTIWEGIKIKFRGLQTQ